MIWLLIVWCGLITGVCWLLWFEIKSRTKMIADVLESLAKASNSHDEQLVRIQLEQCDLRLLSKDATKKVTYTKYVNCIRDEYPDDLKDPTVAERLAESDVVNIASRLFGKDKDIVAHDILKAVEGAK